MAVLTDGDQVAGKLVDNWRLGIHLETSEGLVSLDRRNVQYVLVGERGKKGKEKRKPESSDLQEPA